MAQVQENGDALAAPIVHAPREYQAYPGAKYILPTDDAERQRQHKTLKSMFGNRILFAPVELDENDKVLDVGTGPGLWVLDLAASVDSSTQMIGVDIETRLFPASPPKNIQFRVESVTNLPAEWSNTFSLVHQRLLVVALQVPQWPTALSEIYRVLRPNGWVQIAESTPWHDDIEYPAWPCLAKLAALYRAVARSRNLYVDCAYDMPKMLEAAGFIDVRSESRMQCMGKWAGENGAAMHSNHVGVLRGIKTPVLQAGGYGLVSSEAEFDALVEGLAKEWEEAPGCDKEFIVFWARKPSS
ncbi:S-adenosyl-L-methionine-dependent methyltransferase [Mycena pura]|uniref:S-adenosyl-L-methionine-dependent methyltransferase n=1 Tax=Mycena pura TaxID=153505 RepID=A0AAD6VTL1_9AGAR|nr:S-adenosyl-L-methionine-dependent methyltransferase [Mycena pura]